MSQQIVQTPVYYENLKNNNKNKSAQVRITVDIEYGNVKTKALFKEDHLNPDEFAKKLSLFLVSLND